MKKSLFIIGLLIASIIGASGAQIDYRIYSYDLSNINLDGKISVDEYATSKLISTTKIELRVGWAHNGTHLAVGISGEFTGWIGFGMNEVNGGMTGADMIIASVTGSSVTIKDYYATGNSEPSVDADQMPITAAGEEKNGVTTVEFIIPMKSSDTAGQDHNWEIDKTYSVFFAYHATSDSLVYHTGRTNPLTVEIEDGSVPLPADRYDTVGDSSSSGDRLSVLLWIFGGFAVALVVIQVALKQTKK